MKNSRLWLLLTLLATALGYILFKPLLLPPSGQTEWVPVILFTNLPHSATFKATVDSKEILPGHSVYSRGEGGLPGASTTTRLARLEIMLKKPDGSRIAICADTTDSNALDFAKSLEQGKRYEFPAVFFEWAKLHKHERPSD